MLKRLTPRERFEQLIATWEPVLRAAFIEAIDDIRSNIVLRRIVERLERGDVQGAVRAMNLDEAAYRPLEEAIRQAFNAGGVSAVEGMPALKDPEGHRLVIRFDIRNVEAETWLREHSATLVRNIVSDQQEAIRESLTAGLARGDNPTRTALDVVGRVERATGRRQGGIIGLTTQQARYVENARQELSSGDPEALRNYLGRGRRDKRFDKTIAKALKDGKPLPRETVDKIVGRYSDGLLKLRGEMLARTETMASLQASKHEAHKQAASKGFPVEREWDSAGDRRVRDTHMVMDGQKVGLNEPFVSPSGARLMFPGDPNAPASEIVGCRCDVTYRLNFLKGLR